ncbi:uncharacterized protein LOC131162909 [Malania oleifera]|uniref:uncharacterized protein LOC131162909 n=1 Tax=Malania oleifera TaxID=397392 RepID=UPI0025AEADB9|nr:uncharacterized protein LOC131162909 [Malania oleifera]XP_057975507.1 uncharacterized protein LOC131162909 [Malania oleifera]XP_057975508.1 uncharacterized protein LOC131162909 [Malania oleifera]XP_057975509.1 uncharacterized protein LOC131162909 [Malania oleifera]
MELQFGSCWLRSPKMRLSNNPFFSHQIACASKDGWRDRRCRYVGASRVHWMVGFKMEQKESLVGGLNRVVFASNSNQEAKLKSTGREIASIPVRKFDEVEPFHGKSGSVSFHGLTYQSMEEGKLVSAPFKEGMSSLLWILAPVALISSLVLPPFFLGNAVDAVLKDEVIAEIFASFSSEMMFYIGLAAFLLVTEHVQRPYLEFSAKRWGLITGLKGYLTSAFLTMGLKVFAPLFAVFVTWPVLGLPALVAVAPFLVGCATQFAFETFLDKHGSSCWPLVPIIFEVYRLYQLSKATHFIERLLFAMKGAPITPELLDRNGALVAMVVTFQALGVICLWSLMTFLMRLFPSRPVAEKY